MIIVGLSGRKQSGKGSVCNFLASNAAKFWPKPPIADPDYNHVNQPSAKVFSMAGPLKRFCVEILGLSPSQVYGSDEDKNSLTRYQWGNLPHYDEVVSSMVRHNLERENGTPKHWRWKELVEGEQPKKEYLPGYLTIPGKADYMTARQVLQEVGTGIFRRMWGDIWAQACVREIQAWGGDIAFIDDIRFPNEVAAVQEAKGLVIRLTRDVFRGLDVHESERRLDADVFDWNEFDVVVNNANSSEEFQNRQVVAALVNAGVIGCLDTTRVVGCLAEEEPNGNV